MPVVRATVDFTQAIKPGGVVESDKLPSDVRKRTMDAVDACGGRVTIGDVASRAGLKLNEAQKALQALAADTEGFLEVVICEFLRLQIELMYRIVKILNGLLLYYYYLL